MRLPADGRISPARALRVLLRCVVVQYRDGIIGAEGGKVKADSSKEKSPLFGVELSFYLLDISMPQEDSRSF